MNVKYLVALAAAAVMVPAAGMVYSKTTGNVESNPDPQFITISRAPSFETDFTKAAESTVNSVVCIKSFVMRSQQSYGGNQGGYYDPFGMFDFFFGPQQAPQQRQQPRQKKNEPCRAASDRE